MMEDNAESYCAYYCEENAIRLARRLRDDAAFEQVFVVFITNAVKSCPFFNMKAGNPVFFDYHAVVVARGSTEPWKVFDLDLVADSQCQSFENYYALVFRFAVPPPLSRLFRVVPLSLIDAEFQSDRSHMRKGDEWLAKPPPWPVLNASTSSNLFSRFVDVARHTDEVLSEQDFIDRFSISTSEEVSEQTETATE